MEVLAIAGSVVAPIFFQIFIGYLLKVKKILTQPTLRELNSLTFKLFLPLMMFCNIYTSDILVEFDFKLLSYAIICIILIFGALVLFIPKCEKNNKRASVIIQGVYRSNFVFFGMVIVENLYGSTKMGMTTILVAVIVPIFNLLAVVLFEVFRNDKVDYRKMIKGIITNPLIIASVIGLLCKGVAITFPGSIIATCKTLGNIATPMALLTLGGTFEFRGIVKNSKALLGVCVGRLIVVPIIFVSGAVALGYRNADLAALLVMLASPTAVASFTMAAQMGGDEELAAQIVVVTSILSICTIFIWLVFLLQYQLL